MTGPEGCVAVVAWKELPSNLPLVEGLRRVGIGAELLAPPVARHGLGPGDIALVRLDVRSTLDGVETGLADVAALPAHGVRVLNSPGALVAMHDKRESARRLVHARIPHPWTLHRRRVEDVRSLELPFVLKPRFGSWGRDVMRCRSAAERERCLATIRDRPWFRRHGVLIQELVPPPGHDLRLIVAGGRVVGATERHAAPGEWRTNYALGGSCRPAQPSHETAGLALAAARAMEADLLSVDLLPLPSGDHVVIEVNAAADFDVADSLPGRDVYADIADALGLASTGEAGRTAGRAGRARAGREAISADAPGG